MKISFARNVDRWIGIPLCFLFSVAAKISFRSRGQTFLKPKKVVFLGLTEIGAGIMAYPSIEKLRGTWSEADVYLWVFQDNADFFNATGWFRPGRVIAMRSNSFWSLARDAFRNLWEIRKLGVDTIIDLEASTRFSSLLCFLSGARTRIGFCARSPGFFYRGDLYTHRVTYDPATHISRNFRALVDQLSGRSQLDFSEREDLPFALPRVKMSQEEDERMRRKLRDLGGDALLNRRLVLIHMGLNDRLPMRRWPPECYWKLIDRFLEDPDLVVVLVGTGPKHSFFQSETRPRVIQLVGQTDTRELFSLLNMANVLISHDSGIVHIAALTGIPVVALFGPETPDVFRPLSDRTHMIYKKMACSPCLLVSNYKQTPCQNNQCMKAITVDEVYQEAKIALL